MQVLVNPLLPFNILRLKLQPVRKSRGRRDLEALKLQINQTLSRRCRDLDVLDGRRMGSRKAQVALFRRHRNPLSVSRTLLASSVKLISLVRNST